MYLAAYLLVHTRAHTHTSHTNGLPTYNIPRKVQPYQDSPDSTALGRMTKLITQHINTLILAGSPHWALGFIMKFHGGLMRTSQG